MKKSDPFILILFIILISCNNDNSKDKLAKSDSTSKSENDMDKKSSSLKGQWQFDRTETPASGDLDKAKEDDLKTRNEGIIAVFDGKGYYYSFKERNGMVDTVQSGGYEFIKNGKYIVTHRGNSSDTVEVIEINAKEFKVRSPDNDIVVLKRIN